MKWILRILLILLLLIFLLLLALFIGLQTTPRIFAWYLRHSSTFNGEVSYPEDYAEASSLVSVQNDLTYTSAYGSNTFDLYTNTSANDSAPTLIWVHGGAFVAGDKSAIAPFATEMAAAGYTVIAMNYELSPEGTYPSAILQLGELYTYLQSNETLFPEVDLSRLILGGDSAGAQISAHFIALQTNPILQEEMGLDPLVPKENILAALLYCGPYQLDAFKDADSALMKFFIQQIGWAYLGEKDWMEDEVLSGQVSTYSYVTADFPPTFITDGNSGSFEAQGKALLEKLQSLGVKSTGLFFSSDEGAIPHVYHFKYDQYPTEARKCFNETLAFLSSL